MVFGFINKAADAVKFLNILESAGLPRNSIPKDAIKEINGYIQSTAKNISEITKVPVALSSDGFVKDAAYWAIFFIVGPYSSNTIPAIKHEYENLRRNYERDIGGEWIDPTGEKILSVCMKYQLCDKSVYDDYESGYIPYEITSETEDNDNEELISGGSDDKTKESMNKKVQNNNTNLYESRMNYLKRRLILCTTFNGKHINFKVLETTYVIGYVKAYVSSSIKEKYDNRLDDNEMLKEIVSSYDMLFEIERKRKILKKTIESSRNKLFKEGFSDGMFDFRNSEQDAMNDDNCRLFQHMEKINRSFF